MGGCPDTAPVELYAVFDAPHGAAQTINGEDAMITVIKFFSKVEAAHGGPTPPPSPDAPSAACQQCIKGACDSHKSVHTDCVQCLQEHRQACASACMPFPFQKSLAWECGNEEAFVV